MARRGELIKGSLDSLLLGVLEYQPMYGYQIIRELKHRSLGYFEFKEGTLYPALHRMESSGLVKGTWQMLPKGRYRRYYHITEKGLARLADEKTQWQDFLTAMNLVMQSMKS